MADPAVVASAAQVLGADPTALSHAERIDLLVMLSRVRELADAVELQTLAELARADRSEKQWVREEVACALTIAPATAAGRLHEAADLSDLLPDAAAAVAGGTLTTRQARTLLDLTRSLPAEVRTAVEARVLPRAADRTTAEFRRTVRRAVAALDPRGLEERHATAMLDRRVILRPADHGMSELWALLPADGAATLMATVTALAASPTDDSVRDDRTADQRRADALIALAGSTVDPEGPARAPRISVHLTVPISTLLGDDTPGELAGHGPVPAGVARRLATGPHTIWRRILTDPAGAVVDAGRTYRPPAALREQIRARDRTCRFPGCSTPARLTDTDHIDAWEHGGLTTADNLHSLCTRHHHLKHEAGWTVRRDPDGTTRWQTPTGRRHDTPPEDSVETYRVEPDDPGPGAGSGNDNPPDESPG